MKLIEVLRKDCISAGAEIADKEGLLHEIARLAVKSPVLSGFDKDVIVKALSDREQLGSTGFGKGIAIPHCRLEGLSEFVVGVVTISEGIDFDALDKQPVKLFVFIIGPQNGGNRHIRILSAISQTLLIPGTIEEIIAEKTSEGIFESFLRHTHAEINVQDRRAKRICHVFVQDESVFKDVLSVLAGTEDSSVVVVNSEDAGNYLTNLPLFAGFWTENPSEFCKLIVMVIDKGLTNETVRRIEGVTGNLNESKGILVTFQDLVLSIGNLD